ncbi:hypothetical protein BH11PLA2_BH11PLA2_19890 [soil metagenome]
MPKSQSATDFSQGNPPQLFQALSIKQPWAALIVHGVKTVEVRSWATSRSGTMLIHASKSPEANSDAWKLVTSPELAATAELTGGVIGKVELVECITYRTREEFVADRDRHRAGPEWFKPVRYGFVLANPKRVTFVPWSGNTSFFGVTATLKTLRTQKPKRTSVSKYLIRLPEDQTR